MAKLLIEGVSDSVVAFPLLGDQVLIGRLDSVDLVIEDPAVSRVHAKLVAEDGRMVLVDLDSSLGTTVNGAPVARHALSDGDVIAIGPARLEYRE